MARPCPCHSGAPYAACCAPYHRGEKEALTPEALMRSRYAAFAIGDGAYLVKTLAAAHPDRTEPDLARSLGRVKERQRFLDLRILHAPVPATDAGEGEVLFLARIFERGVNRSFAELSRFVKEEGAWRYAEGTMVPADRLPKDLGTLTREQFVELASAMG